MRKLTISLALIFSLLFVQIAAANLVTNGDFETGDFTGWTVIPATDGSLVFVDNLGGGHTGDFSARFGALGSEDDTITQNISTVAGQTYTFDFWLSHGQPDGANDFHASWNGTSLLDIVNAVSSFDWTHYTFTETATGSSSTIAFAGLEVQDFYFLDDVNVSQNSEVPLPGAVVLLGSGLLPLLGWRRLRKG